jgi:hypothetical protein
MVGEFFQQAVRKRWIDSAVEFDIPRPRPRERERPPQGPQDPLRGVFDLLRRIFR